jgi:glycosyltransferase involved in cell wall biosynthesis
MRILLLANEFPPNIGGLANLTYNIAKGLSVNNEVFVISFSPEEQGIGFDATPPTFPDLLYYPRRAVPYLRNVGARIHEMAKKGEIDVVYSICFTTYFTVLGVYSKILGLPLVSHAVGLDLYSHRFKDRLSRRVAYLASDAIICWTNFQKSMMSKEGADPGKLYVIYGGVDTELFKPYIDERETLRRFYQLEDKFILLAAGRLIARKGFDDAIRALSLLKDLKDVVLIVVGDGPERTNLEGLAKALHLEDRVRFLGLLPSEPLPKVFSMADVFIAPFKVLGTDLEGSPMVVKESQASGLPVITTNTPGMEEVVEDGLDGFIVPMNSPIKLAEKVRTLFEQPKLRSMLAENARKKAVELFDWRAYTKKVEAILSEVCE